jgi:transposase
MMTITIKDDQWSKILEFIRACPGIYVGKEASCRRFVEGVLWITRSGAQWRLLPESYGNWNSVYKRFARWSDKGIFDQLLQFVVDDPDLEHVLADSTIVRAHPCAAGAPKKRGGQAAQALGRSRGGFSTKIHISTEALGNPLRLILTAGQRHDITQAQALIEGLEAEKVIADKAFDKDEFRQFILQSGAIPVIPPRTNRKELYDYDEHLYKERHLIECFINKLKHYRRIFSRFDKLAHHFLSFVSFASALIWLR